MKLLTTSFIFLASLAVAGTDHHTKSIALPDGHSKTINVIDTVVFDLSNATLTASYIDIPVSFLSDDTVDALDFKFKINETELTYDSIINLNPDLSALAYFNPDDRFLRLTSYSMNRMPNNTIQLSLRFLTSNSSANISDADFDSIEVYLNGEPCSYRIRGRAVTGIGEMKNNNLFSVYPNPATTALNVVSSEDATLQLLDISGRQIFIQTAIIANTKNEINTEDIANGIYTMKVTGKNFVSAKKVVINK